MRQTVLILAVALLAAACAPAVTVRTDHDPAADFSRYRSFAWISDDPWINPEGATSASPLTKKRIMDAIEAELVAKGYTQVARPDGADFVLAFTVGSRDKIKVDSYPTTYRGAWGWGPYYGPRYGVTYGTEVVTREYTQGMLAIDMFDTRTKSPVWHGYAEKNITEADREDPVTAIREAVQAIFAEFPPT